jgi:hypothetical protein
MAKIQSEAGPERTLRRLLTSNPRGEGDLQERCAEVADWSSLSTSAERHGVLGILHRELTAAPTPGRLPPEFATELRRRAALQRLLQSQNYAVLNEILAALDRAGVETATLKGPVLGERLYGDPTLRVATDLDLMVARDQVAVARDVLAGLGYQVEPEPPAHERWGHHIKATREDSPIVELHYRLTTNFGALLPSEEFLSRSLGYRTARGARCRVLSAEDELLYLVLHAAEHLFARLAWLYDIKALLAAHPEIDWAVVADRAQAYGVECPYAFAIDLIARQMEIALPAGVVLPAISRARTLAAWALLSAAGHSSSRVPESVFGHLFRAALTDRPSSGANYLWRQLQRVRRQRRARPRPHAVPENP